MNKEQIEELSRALAAMREAVVESEAMVKDYMQCCSEISKKYLGAAIKKQVSRVVSLVPAGFSDQQ